jgi:hypothetical protein
LLAQNQQQAACQPLRHDLISASNNPDVTSPNGLHLGFAVFHKNLDERCVHFRDIDDQLEYDFGDELEERKLEDEQNSQT